MRLGVLLACALLLMYSCTVVVYCCSYFKKYNYQIKETGEVITFEGVYAADRGQAAAVTFYTFAGGLLTAPVPQCSSGA